MLVFALVVAVALGFAVRVGWRRRGRNFWKWCPSNDGVSGVEVMRPSVSGESILTCTPSPHVHFMPLNFFEVFRDAIHTTT